MIATVLVATMMFQVSASAQCTSCNAAPMVSQSFGMMPPATMYGYRAVPQAYNLQSMNYSQRVYPTPVRNMLFGRGQVNYQYAPAAAPPPVASFRYEVELK